MTKIRSFINRRLFILGCFSCVAFLASQLLGRTIWQLELFSHYTPHLAITIVLAAMLYPINKPKLIRVIFIILGFSLMLWSVQPLSVYLPSNKSSTYEPIRIAFQNVLLINKKQKETLVQLTQEKPDILLLVEASDRWDKTLAPIIKKYPVYCGNPSASFLAMRAMISDNRASCEFIKNIEYPTIKITLSDDRVIFVVHPVPPLNATSAKKQVNFLKSLHQLVIKEKNALVIGDMNLSAFSPHYRDFIDNTNLQRSFANGLPTWLPLGISIDQVLTNAKHQAKTTPLLWKGSDHRGLLVEW